MAKKEQEYTKVPYENTLYDLLINEITGKYFQCIHAPHLIAHFPEKDGLEIHLIESKGISAWFPFMGNVGEYMPIPIEEFNQFAEITKEQFKKYEKEKTNISNVILAHKNSPFFKEGNKANLSEEKSPKRSKRFHI